MKRIIGIIAIVAVFGIAGWYFATQGSNATAGTTPDAGGTSQDFGIADVTLGNPDASVVVTEYASYTCPHCGRFHNGPFKELKADYIDTGKIKFVYREVFFDRPGLWASMVARCVAPDRYFGVADMIYKDQAKWSRAGDPAAIIGELRTIGKLAGLDDAALDACLEDGEKAENLMAWYQANQAADNITATPSFLINGQLHSNMSYADMKRLIDAALAN